MNDQVMTVAKKQSPFIQALLCKASKDGGDPVLSIEELAFNVGFFYLFYVVTALTLNKTKGVKDNRKLISITIPFRPAGAGSFKKTGGNSSEMINVTPNGETSKEA